MSFDGSLDEGALHSATTNSTHYIHSTVIFIVSPPLQALITDSICSRQFAFRLISSADDCVYRTTWFPPICLCLLYKTTGTATASIHSFSETLKDNRQRMAKLSDLFKLLVLIQVVNLTRSMPLGDEPTFDSAVSVSSRCCVLFHSTPRCAWKPCLYSLDNPSAVRPGPKRPGPTSGIRAESEFLPSSPADAAQPPLPHSQPVQQRPVQALGGVARQTELGADQLAARPSQEHGVGRQVRTLLGHVASPAHLPRKFFEKFFLAPERLIHINWFCK